MNGSLRVKDRNTFEEGRLFQSLKTGWVKVLMDNGEVREYRPKDLIASIDTTLQKELQNVPFSTRAVKQNRP
ncbi:hypothetical protein GZ77_22790 [Endozoicomonas montiporae]|uniref:Uncharacterized protein n=2 Tax=Endozoicomonas montiporae TaxID=1027273 RepID=A0A081N0G3_9GAMM|nr:hypothetical protein [Endozoicomonas montiporae]AMO54395.1 hypothetical protein EZMO1_0123 [Endozoicomonas montiporae CL-33]KEQ11936.1 hypothetical protein GZ77_22790 [Endozoicomonas montiporae]